MSDAAPLIATPDAPIPAGAEAAWVTGAGGVQLRAALFTPNRSRVRGSIVLSGGRTEPIEKYFELIEDFLSRGFVVLAHDWRGQGLSARPLADPLKGHASGIKAYLEDFQKLLAAYQSRLPKPWIAVAHSMGGCLTLLALAQGEDRFSGAIFSAPMLGIRTGKISRPVGEAMARANCLFGRSGRYTLGDPGKPFDDTFEGNALTHDRTRFARHRAQIAAEPRLALGGPTWGWVDFAFRATAWLARPERLRNVTIPVIILSAEQDALVDNAAQAAAARHLPQGKLITVHGAKHEILMETDDMRNIFLRAFDTLTGRTAPKPAEPPKAAPAASAPAPAPRPAPTPAPTPAAAPAAAAASAPKPPAAKKPAAKRKPAAKKKPAAKPAAAKKAPAAKKAGAKPAAARKAPAAKKPAGKKPAAKKPAAKAAAAKKAPAAKKPAAKKPAAKKPAAKKPAAKKPAAKAAAAKKAPAAKKPAAKKPAAKKPAAKKAPAKKPA